MEHISRNLVVLMADEIQPKNTSECSHYHYLEQFRGIAYMV